MNMKSKKAFTLLELIITISIIAIIGVILIILFNPWQQLGKGFDARRKSDLDILKKVLEDYYNDKGCYPQANEICYDNTTDVSVGVGHASLIGKQCHICGNEPTSPSFSPYLTQLPCDPQHPAKKYLYSYDCPGGVCPACIPEYVIYSALTTIGDQSISNLGCLGDGCGNPPDYGYAYGVSSSNTRLNISNRFNCISITGKCNACGSGGYLSCITDVGCPDKSKIYSSSTVCCNQNPGACN